METDVSKVKKYKEDLKRSEQYEKEYSLPDGSMINLGKEDFVVNRNDRIAQMNFKRVEHAQFDEVKELDSSERKGGFGSTGK